MASVIGIIGDGIGVYSFVAALFAAKAAQNVCTVRVAAALNGGSLSGADGSVQGIRLFNENQASLGGSIGSAKYIGSGGFYDIKVTQPNNQQATYAQIVATNDAVCIPYVTTTLVDGSKYGWVGDFGAACGLEWYYGNVYVENGSRKPKCTWIDADHTNGYKAGMLMIHFPSFAGAEPHSTKTADYCGFPEFRAYTQGTGGSVIFRRDAIDAFDAIAASEANKPTKRAVDSRLVISSDPSHNATALCESPTSRGPDFVSLAEGIYCNMEISETLPLCSEEFRTNCFNLGWNAKVKRDGEMMEKTYVDVIHWD